MHRDSSSFSISQLSHKVFDAGAQEEELTKLYDILEAQRQEIENLNHLLDTMAAGGSAAGQNCDYSTHSLFLLNSGHLNVYTVF